MGAWVVVCWKSVLRRSLDKTKNPEIKRKMVVLNIFALNKRGCNGIVNPSIRTIAKKAGILISSLYRPRNKELTPTDMLFQCLESRLVTFHHR